MQHKKRESVSEEASAPALVFSRTTGPSVLQENRTWVPAAHLLNQRPLKGDQSMGFETVTWSILNSAQQGWLEESL